MCRFIESIKIENGKIFLLELHQKRVDETFVHFGKKYPLDLLEILDKTIIKENGLFKLRIVYDLKGNYETEVIPYQYKEIHTFELVENHTLDYSLKFEDREAFAQMKSIARSEEIIIVKNNYITDSSYSNLLFLKDEKWFTPSTFLLNGVQRQELIRSELITETEITLDNIREFSHFKLINAMNNAKNSFIYEIKKIIDLH